MAGPTGAPIRQSHDTASLILRRVSHFKPGLAGGESRCRAHSLQCWGDTAARQSCVPCLASRAALVWWSAACRDGPSLSCQDNGVRNHVRRRANCDAHSAVDVPWSYSSHRRASPRVLPSNSSLPSTFFFFICSIPVPSLCGQELLYL